MTVTVDNRTSRVVITPAGPPARIIVASRGVPGPQGPAGPQGPEGPQGPKGDTGPMDPAVYDPQAIGADAFARANHTGTQSADTITDGTTNKVYTATEQTKLAGIEEGADVTADALVAATDASGFGFVNSAGPLADSGTTLASESVVKAYADTKQPADANLTTLSSGTTTLGAMGLSLLGTATADEAVTALNVKALNDDGGFTFNLTGTPTSLLGPLFGSTNRTHHRFVSDTDSTHSTDAGDTANTAWQAVSIVHNFKGSGGPSGGAQVDRAIWIDAQKKGWSPGSAPDHEVGEGVKGPVSTIHGRAINNEWGDTALHVGSSSKIMVSDVPGTGTGSNLIAEWATISYDTDGETILRELHTFVGWDQVNLTGALHPGKNSGFNVRPHVGDTFAAYVSSAPAATYGVEYFAFATTNDSQANAYFAVTGNKHSDGSGRVRASSSNSSFPAYSFINDNDTGMYSSADNNIDFATNGIQRMSIVGGAFVRTQLTMWAHSSTAIPAGGTTGAGFRLSSTGNFGIFFGSGAPTLTAAKGSLYLRSDGSGTSDRLYVNMDGSTGWTAVATVA